MSAAVILIDAGPGPDHQKKKASAPAGALALFSQVV